MYGCNSISTTANYNMNPRQEGFNHFINVSIFRDDDMLSEIIGKVIMGRRVVSNYNSILCDMLTDNAIYCLCTQIIDYQHLYVVYDFSDRFAFGFFRQTLDLLRSSFRTFLPIINKHLINLFAFDNYKYLRLLLASGTSFERMVPVILWNTYGEKCFIKFNLVRKLVDGVTFPHDVAEFHHHQPNWWILRGS